MMSPEEKAQWLQARAGCLTASRMADAMNFRKDGKSGADRNNYLRDLLAERMTDHSVRHYVTPAMEWGILHEDDARIAYEAATGTLVTDPRAAVEHGLFCHPLIENFKASPDGLIDADGLIETKCPTTGTFIDWKVAGIVPDEHKPQMLAQIACSKRKWCEFVAYDPRFREPQRRLFIRRYTPKADEIAAVEVAAERFLAELDAMFQAFVEAA